MKFYMPFFDLVHKDKNSHARAGVMHTDHGDIETPVFMPVGTQASVKTLDQADLEKLDAQIILSNTYHLHLRPGEDLIAEQGGLHKFMNWPKPILTDSGGFQVFSLGLQKAKKQEIHQSKNQKNNETIEQSNNKTNGKLVAIDEDGVTFQSHIDGSTRRLTPESATEIQHKLGADIIMAFDECTPDDATREYTQEAMERTHRWAERCLAEHRRLQTLPPPHKPLLHKEGIFAPASRRRGEGGVSPYRQFLFGIIQGANYQDLRQESAKFISSLDFDGVAIGGESIGYNMEATANILDWVYPIIPENKPHYAMGIGLSPTDLLIAVEHGVDMFDCVAPTRLARHGLLLVGRAESDTYRLNIKNAAFTKDTRPIDATCACSTCATYTRSYLHHLFAAEEMTALRLASIHNIHFLLNLMRETREAIKEDRFMEFKKQWI